MEREINKTKYNYQILGGLYKLLLDLTYFPEKFNKVR